MSTPNTATDLTLEQEAALQTRDDRVAKTIREAIAYKRDLARQMRDEAKDLERQAAEIEEAAKTGHYERLERLLGREDTESLCAITPDDLLGREVW